MAGRSGMRTYPRHAPRDGRGVRIDDASGFLRPADKAIYDVRQGVVAPEFADITPGFGTRHPQDQRRLPPADDPKPVAHPRTEGNPSALSPRDMGYTDADVARSIRLGVPLLSLTPSGISNP